MQPLTIVHTEASLGWGGQEIRVFTEMQAMRARGHHLLLAAQPGGRLFQKACADGFDVFPITEKSILFPVTIIRLALWLRRQKVQVVNTHSSRDGWIGGIAARLAGVPCIIRSKHIDVDYPRKFSSRIAYGKLPHHVLTTSEQIRRKITHDLSIPETKITNLPTGIDPAPFLGPVTPDLRAELKLKPDVPVIGMISVIRSWKGHRTFLEAAQLLLKEMPDIHFVIAGDGPGYAKLLATIEKLGLKDRVTCLGHRQDVPALLKAFNILVLPSLAHEGVPQIILQAQMARCPVVATAIGGIPEVVEDGKTGRLVPPSRSDALKEAMALTLQHRQESLLMAENAFQNVMQNHTIDTMCRKLLSLYSELLEQPVTQNRNNC